MQCSMKTLSIYISGHVSSIYTQWCTEFEPFLISSASIKFILSKRKAYTHESILTVQNH